MYPSVITVTADDLARIVDAEGSGTFSPWSIESGEGATAVKEAAITGITNDLTRVACALVPFGTQA
jgi:hypothetical protein